MCLDSCHTSHVLVMPQVVRQEWLSKFGGLTDLAVDRTPVEVQLQDLDNLQPSSFQQQPLLWKSNVHILHTPGKTSPCEQSLCPHQCVHVFNVSGGSNWSNILFGLLKSLLC